MSRTDYSHVLVRGNRHDAFTTTHSYNRLTRLTKGRRKETRGHTLKAYGRPSTNDLENFLVLGPLDRLSRFLAGDRSRSISGPENCTSRTEYARNGKRTPRHRTGAIAASAINTTLLCRIRAGRRDDDKRKTKERRHPPGYIPGALWPAKPRPRISHPGAFSLLPSSLSLSLFLPFSLFSASFRCPRRVLAFASRP